MANTRMKQRLAELYPGVETGPRTEPMALPDICQSIEAAAHANLEALSTLSEGSTASIKGLAEAMGGEIQQLSKDLAKAQEANAATVATALAEGREPDPAQARILEAVESTLRSLETIALAPRPEQDPVAYHFTVNRGRDGYIQSIDAIPLED